MGPIIDHFDSRVYFWDVNLPGEMLTRMIPHSSHSQGVKILFNISNASQLGLKIRINYLELSLNSNVDISSGLFIQAAL